MNKELIQKLFSKSFWDEQEEVDIEDFISVEKLIELIVRECARVAKLTEADDGDDYKSGRQWAGIDVLTHFGVEE